MKLAMGTIRGFRAMNPHQVFGKRTRKWSKAKSRKYQGVFEDKSREKTWQVRGIWSQQLEQKQVPQWGTEPGVRKGKRSLLACHTEIYVLENLIKPIGMIGSEMQVKWLKSILSPTFCVAAILCDCYCPFQDYCGTDLFFERGGGIHVRDTVMQQ